MRIVRTVHFDAQLTALLNVHASISLPVEMELRFAATNPDVTKPVADGRSDLRFLVLNGIPNAPDVILSYLVRGEVATFFDVTTGASPLAS